METARRSWRSCSPSPAPFIPGSSAPTAPTSRQSIRSGPTTTTLWGGSAFATVEDAFLEVIDAETFAGVSGRKFSASTIPVAAVLHRLGLADALPGWRELVDRLGGFYQMVNDLLDWHHDARAGIRTFFLSEANRRRREGEPLAAWVAPGGILLGRRRARRIDGRSGAARRSVDGSRSRRVSHRPIGPAARATGGGGERPPRSRSDSSPPLFETGPAQSSAAVTFTRTKEQTSCRSRNSRTCCTRP